MDCCESESCCQSLKRRLCDMMVSGILGAMSFWPAISLELYPGMGSERTWSEDKGQQG